MNMIEYEIEQYKGYKFEEKLNFHLVLSESLAKRHWRYGCLRQYRPLQNLISQIELKKDLFFKIPQFPTKIKWGLEIIASIHVFNIDA